MPENPKPEGVEPVEAYRLRDLPVGTKVLFPGASGPLITNQHHGASRTLVYVEEWPAPPPPRTYDGVPAAELDLLVRRASVSGLSTLYQAAQRIAKAIAEQQEGQP